MKVFEIAAVMVWSLDIHLVDQLELQLVKRKVSMKASGLVGCLD